MTRRSSPARRDACAWCAGPIPPGARADSIYCSTSHRQAHRAKVQRTELEATDRPLRLAYADPPYIGLAHRYYGDHPDYDGEVDHGPLIDRLATYDGWALSCSSASVPAIAALLVARDVEARLAIWHRRPAPHKDARLVTAYEGVWISPARRVVPGSRERLTDVLLGVESARIRPTLPTSVTGMKPPGFLVWLFKLLGAMPGDSLDDLFPGSGMVSRSWTAYAGILAPRPGETLPLFDPSTVAAADA